MKYKITDGVNWAHCQIGSNKLFNPICSDMKFQLPMSISFQLTEFSSPPFSITFWKIYTAIPRQFNKVQGQLYPAGNKLPSTMANISLNSTCTISMNSWRSICFITRQPRQLLKLNTSPPTEAVAKSKPVQPRGVSLIRRSARPCKILHQALTLLHDACLTSLVLIWPTLNSHYSNICILLLWNTGFSFLNSFQ